MYNVKTRADKSGYTNHRVICLVVIGSSFDSEEVSPPTLTFFISNYSNLIFAYDPINFYTEIG